MPSSEQSSRISMDGQLPGGTPGSVRVDVVEGPVNNPTAVYDLKTGNARLSPARVSQIQSHLPQNASGTKIPVKEIKPQ
jgi:hypothetical protein